MNDLQYIFLGRDYLVDEWKEKKSRLLGSRDSPCRTLTHLDADIPILQVYQRSCLGTTRYLGSAKCNISSVSAL